MSRNSRRTRIPKSVEPPAAKPQPNVIPPAQKEKPNPFGLSFAVETEIVHLPSGGNFYDEGSALNGIETVEIKAMTAKEEDILINESFIEQGSIFDRLIDSLMITPGIQAQELLDCDKVAILVSARKTGYGNTLEVSHDCEDCGKTTDVSLDLSKMLENAKEGKFEIEDTEEWQYDRTSKTFMVNLPVTEIQARIKLLTPSDVKYLQQAKKQKEKLSLPYNETIEFVRKVLVSANDVVDPALLTSLLDVLPAADARRIKYVHNVNIPAFDTKQEISCSNCSARAEKEAPFSVGWFWSI
jgi:hypothetical protein